MRVLLLFLVIVAALAFAAVKFDVLGTSDVAPVDTVDDFVVEQAQLSMPLVLLRDPRKQSRRVSILSDDWLYCYPPTGKVYRVPRGYLTDFASIPEAVQGLINPFGDHAEAAVIHDWLYAVGEEGKRLEADQIFRFAMQEQGVGFLPRRTMYQSVRMGGNEAYGADQEWTFFDPLTLKPVEPPFEKPADAHVAEIPCDEFETQYFELRQTYISYGTFSDD